MMIIFLYAMREIVHLTQTLDYIAQQNTQELLRFPNPHHVDRQRGFEAHRRNFMDMKLYLK